MNIKRKTKSVELILNTFKDSTAISIIDLVKKFKHNMDKTTVYRILNRLEQSKILHSFIDQNGNKRYAKNNTSIDSNNLIYNHSHFLCQQCGISLCVPIELKIPKNPTYKVNSSEHLLIGECNKCEN